MSGKNLIVFDCDSTLSAIEGVDELGALRGDAIRDEVTALTDQAMDGTVPIGEVFARRLDLIRPTAAECAAVGQHYLDQIEPDAENTIAWLRQHDWDIAILSGGFTPCIAPLAQHLGITRIEAVPLTFDAEGNYHAFGAAYPTTRNGGKTEVIHQLKKELAPPRTVMVGDGVSDLETKDAVDLFVGFGRYATRARVKEGADAFVMALGELPALVSKFLA